MDTWVVAAMYHFKPWPDFENWQERLTMLGEKWEICGSLLIAKEGINGTVAGSREAIDALLKFLKEEVGFSGLEHKESLASKKPFHRYKVRLKKEIVTFGQPDIDPNQKVGEYIDPKDWNALIEDPEVVLVDTRNDYEVEIGTFKGAVDPKTDNFREFPEFVEQNLDPNKHKKVAMFCTGGIRCEKATAYMLNQGFENVYHLKGGILKYLEEVPEEKSLWEGECFVFDQRIAVKHGLKEGTYDMCYGCRSPISDEDKKSEHFEEGISCPHCIHLMTEARRKRLESRQRQIRWAKDQGRSHVGAKMPRQAK